MPVTLLLSRASALCSSFCLKQFVHFVLLKMFGENFLHSPDLISWEDIVRVSGNEIHQEGNFTEGRGIVSNLPKKKRDVGLRRKTLHRRRDRTGRSAPDLRCMANHLGPKLTTETR